MSFLGENPVKVLVGTNVNFIDTDTKCKTLLSQGSVIDLLVSSKSKKCRRNLK